MAGLKRCLGVDLGTHSVKVVELAQVKNQRELSVLKMCEAKLELAPDASQQERRDKMVQALRELLRENHIQTKRAAFSLPGQTVFVRHFPLPFTTEERLERIVRFEARQQIPFPADQTVLQWQVFQGATEGEVEVLLVALRKDIVADFMSVASKSGLQIVQVCVSSFALYNYHAFASRGGVLADDPLAKKPAGAKSRKSFLSLPFRKKKTDDRQEEQQKEADEAETSFELEEIKAYVNLGASTFDLAIHRQGEQDLLGFVRSVPVAGNEITRALQRHRAIDDFQEAEQLKENRVQLIVPGYEEELPEYIDRSASEAISRSVDRMVNELRRSLDFYISRPDGAAVDGVCLSGGLAQLPNLALYIEDKLGMPVEVAAAPTESEAFKFPDQHPEELGQYLVALGLGLSGLDHGQIRVSFLPRAQQVQIEFRKKRLQVAALGALLLVMLGLSWSVAESHVSLYKRWTQDLRSDKRRLTTTANHINTMEVSRKEIFRQFELLGNALPAQQDYWFELFMTLLKVKPIAVMFTRIEFDARGTVVIEGLSQTRPSVAHFLTGLREDKACAKFIDEVEMGEDSFEEVFDADFGKNVTFFRIYLYLKEATTRFQEFDDYGTDAGTATSTGNAGSDRYNYE
ncbi:type IV pilus assembly protein PilM [Candidatus Sumerlaeota bacterium]